MCQVKPGPRCACDAHLDLIRSQEAFQRAHPGVDLPDALRDAGTVAMQHARWQVARQDARLADQELADARRLGHDAAYVAALEQYRDGALSRALAAQEGLAGTWQKREATRAEHLTKHGPSVLAAQPADEPAAPVRTDQWGADGRHLVSGTRFDEAGYDRQGYHRSTQRDALGYHRMTGTLLSPSGHLPDGRHHTEAGLSRDEAHLATADDVVSGSVSLPPAPRPTSAARAIADAKRGEKADARSAKVAAPAPVAPLAPVPADAPASALAPAARLAVNPDHDAIARAVAERGADARVPAGVAGKLLGADREGVAALEHAGVLATERVVREEGGARTLETHVRLGSVAEVAHAAAATPRPAGVVRAFEPIRTKGAARVALGEPGTRWTSIGPNGEQGRTVTVVRSSTTSRWTRGDDDEPGQRPAYRSLELGPGWKVRDDGQGVTDESGWSIIRAA